MVVKSVRKSPRTSSPPSRTSKEQVKEVLGGFKASAHIYVPRHEIMSRVEAEHIFRQYHALPEQFPYILSSDPVVKELGARPGDLLRINRQSGTAGESIYYRVVVEG